MMLGQTCDNLARAARPKKVTTEQNHKMALVACEFLKMDKNDPQVMFDLEKLMSLLVGMLGLEQQS